MALKVNATASFRVTEMTLSKRGKEHKHDYYVYQGRFVGERNLLDKNDFVCFLLLPESIQMSVIVEQNLLCRKDFVICREFQAMNLIQSSKIDYPQSFNLIQSATLQA